MMDSDDDRLADKVAKEPVIFMDCTISEVITAGGASLVGGLVTGIIVGIVIGKIMVGIIIGLLLGMASAWICLTQIQRLRNAYYENWLAEKIFLIKQSIGMGRLTMTTGSKRFGRGGRKSGC
jgi:conjugative transfer region protein (TIGR03750 family)